MIISARYTISIFFCIKIIVSQLLFAQALPADKIKAFQDLLANPSLQGSEVSFCLIDIKSGKVLFEIQKDKLLAPASTLKTFTTATALKVLGSDYTFQTPIYFKGKIIEKHAVGDIIIEANGDPTFGSHRFKATKPTYIISEIVAALQKMNINHWTGKIRIVNHFMDDTAIHSTWLDEDIGNYYGAGIYPLNWKENSFEVNLMTTQHSFVVTSNTAHCDNGKDFCIDIQHKDDATTQEVFAFIEKNSHCKYTLRGVLSNKEKHYNLRLASLMPEYDFTNELLTAIKKVGTVTYKDTIISAATTQLLYMHTSPSLEHIIYWCNQKSINLYAESLCKSIAKQQFKIGNWKLGTAAMLRYARSMGLPVDSVQLKDGSGLSPDNRITTFVLASLLKCYKKETYFPMFFNSLPEINGLRMKSGYIGGTRSYAGYITLFDGREAAFAFIIHGYSCSPREVKTKMFQCLDVLK
jgi:D-alanyl-D-alanine carboxypeptidase, serine-type, PBP4 family